MVLKKISMKKTLLTVIVSIISFLTFAQNVGIGTSTPKELSKLDVESTTSGFMLPRMTTAQRATLGGNISALGAALSIQYNGMMVYDMTNNTLYMWDSNKTDFANGGWNNVLDADASVTDADADPNNEIQDLSLSGNTLSLSGDATTVNLAPYLDNTDDQKIDVFSLSGSMLNLSLESDGEATKTVDLAPLKDHDWYESTGTSQADNINDNIYTQGNVAIGTTNAFSKLDVRGNALIGSSFTPNATTTTTNILNMVVGSTDVGNENGISFYENANFGMSLGYDGLGTGALNALRFYNNSFNPIVTIENGGEVGINTTAPAAQLEVDGDFRLSGQNSKIEFDTKELNNGWTLIYRDDFESSNDGWQMYENNTSAIVDNTFDRESFGAIGLSTNLNNYNKGNDEDNVFKKLYDMSGVTWTQAKITFDYLFIDSWDGRERAYAGVQASLTGNPAILWVEDFDGNDDAGRINYSWTGTNSSFNDAVRTATLHIQNNVMTNGNFYLIIGSTLGSDTDDEAYGIDNVEVWVR